jgi:hypothetical protein
MPTPVFCWNPMCFACLSAFPLPFLRSPLAQKAYLAATTSMLGLSSGLVDQHCWSSSLSEAGREGLMGGLQDGSRTPGKGSGKMHRGVKHMSTMLQYVQASPAQRVAGEGRARRGHW